MAMIVMMMIVYSNIPWLALPISVAFWRDSCRTPCGRYPCCCFAGQPSILTTLRTVHPTCIEYSVSNSSVLCLWRVLRAAMRWPAGVHSNLWNLCADTQACNTRSSILIQFAPFYLLCASICFPILVPAPTGAVGEPHWPSYHNQEL